MDDLCASLAESQHFAVAKTVTEYWPLYHDHSSQSLALEVDFKLAMLDLGNFRFQGKFLDAYPELLLLIQSDSTISCETLR